MSPHTGESRYTFGQLFLWDGVDFVSVVLAIFVVPEMLRLAVDGDSKPAGNSAPEAPLAYREVATGIADVIRHRWLALRTSLIGAFVGLVPGLGGDVASWICYGHAVQSSRDKTRFGHGAIEGVIGPETANNSKEGGALLPTLLFGVPGSSGMAVLLGALVVLGIQPGPQILLVQGDLVWQLFAALVLANLLGALLLLSLSPYLSRISHAPSTLLVPLVLSVAVLGSTLSAVHWQHLLVFLGVGIFACGLKWYDWPRPPFVIGLALGPIAENSLHQAMIIWGPAFLLRPVSLFLLGLIVVNIAIYYWRKKLEGPSDER
jgi:TctA family transporter